jgi:hypothetical protein
MMKHLEENKKDYLKIVNDLDLLKKGARDLKNKTGQKFSLRKKVETPDIKKMIEEVKGTKWYTPGMLDDYKREMDVIRERNKDIDKRFEVDDEKVDDLLREVPPGLNDVKLKERGKNGQEK